MPQERENPLPVGLAVELTTQLDDSDDERYGLLAAGQRPYDDIEGQIGHRPHAFAATLPNRLVAYLDRAPQFSQGARPPASLMKPRRPPADAVEPALTLVEACRRLADEEPALFACVLLCGLKGWSERAAAAELGIANGLVNRRKWAGMAQLVVWSRQPEGAVIAWLDGLRKLYAAREADAAAMTEAGAAGM